VKDNGGPKPIPVQPSDSEDSRHNGSSQFEPNQGGKENQENQTDHIEAHNSSDQDQTPQHDEVINQVDQPDMSLPGSNFSDDPQQKPPGDITTPSLSIPNGADNNGKLK